MTETHSPTPDKPTMLTRPQLVKRGWTEGAITRFLGEPDSTRPNPLTPRNRWSGRVRLYAEERVEAVEASPEFLAWRESRAGKTRSGKGRAGKTEQ